MQISTELDRSAGRVPGARTDVLIWCALLFAACSDPGDRTSFGDGGPALDARVAPAAASLLLDDAAAAPIAAYSVALKLRAAYAGPALRVRRASDGAHAEIGFTATGRVDAGAIATFCGDSDCFVAVLYDQSGHAQDLSQADPAAQIEIYDGATRALVGGGPTPLLSVNTPGRTVRRSGTLGLSGNPAFTIAYAGRYFVGPSGTASEVLPIRIFGSASATSGNQIGLGFAPVIANAYAMSGDGQFGWATSAVTDMNRGVLRHQAGAAIGASTFRFDGVDLGTPTLSQNASGPFDFRPTGFTMLGKDSNNQNDAGAELSTVLIWDTVLGEDDLARVDSLLDPSTSAAPSTLCYGAPGTQALAPFPMVGLCPAHRGQSPVVGPQTNATRWTAQIGSGAARGAAVIAADGTIFAPSTGRLAALDPATGSTLWNVSARSPGSSPAIGADGTVYSISSWNELEARNPSDGSLKWSFGVDSVASTGPAIAPDGTIYVTSQNGRISALTPAGAAKWTVTGAAISTSPAIGADGTIYVGANDGLHAIQPDGTARWTASFGTGAFVRSSPAIAPDGTIYVGTDTGRLVAVDPDGTTRWEFVTGGAIRSSPAIADDGTIHVGSRDRYVYAVRPDGTQKWRRSTGANVDSTAAIGADGVVYIGADNGRLYALRPADGTVLFSVNGGSAFRSPVTIGRDGTVYAGDEGARLFAIGPAPACAASDSTCDGKDDDCNGALDEDYAGQVTSCGIGACARTGATACVDGQVRDSCVPNEPSAGDMTCDGVDDDCNGEVDDSCGVDLVVNGTFETGAAPNVGRKVEGGVVLDAPEFVQWETTDTGGTGGALRVEIVNDPADPYHSHNAGAAIGFTPAVPPGVWLRVTFRAKSVSGGTLLQTIKMWGGSTSARTRITTSWESYELYTLTGQDTSELVFNLVSADDAQQQPLADGVFLLDDVQVEIVPSCPSCGVPAPAPTVVKLTPESIAPDGATWVDANGSGVVFNAGAGTRAPLLLTGLDGRRALRFAGWHYMQGSLGDTANWSGVTITAAFRLTGAPPLAALFASGGAPGSSTATPGVRWALGVGNDPVRGLGWAGADGSTHLGGGGYDYDSATYYVMTWKRGRTGSGWTVRRNGQALTSSPIPDSSFPTGAFNAFLGSEIIPNGSHAGAAITLYELHVYPEELDEEDTTAVEQALADAYHVGWYADGVTTAPDALLGSDLVAWYDAFDLTGADGSAVSSWPNRAGNAALTASGTAQPVLATSGIHGHPSVVADGVDDFMLATLDPPMPAGSRPHFWAVLRQVVPRPSATFVRVGYGGSHLVTVGTNAGASPNWLAIIRGGSGLTTPSAASADNTVAHIIASGTAAEPREQLKIDGLSASSTADPGPISSPLSMIRLFSSEGFGFGNAHLGEVIVSRTTPTPEVDRAVHRYLAAKWRGAAPSCGDGTVDPGEQCDDGNTDGGDGCSASCALEQACSSCEGGDACCPAGCTSANDSDCEAGSPCANASSCAGGDGCCPAGCETSGDGDCPPRPLCEVPPCEDVEPANDISYKHQELGGDQGFLGPATSPYLTSDTGYKRRYQNGTIYSSVDTGPHEVHGAIAERYNAWGEEAGLLGYPTTDEQTAPDGIGKYNQFQHGAIYYSPATGAHVVFGAIRDKWAELGWEAGFLGYPTQDSAFAPDSTGVYSYFQGGAIYWSPATGAHEVHGWILERWASWGWEAGPLGYPVTGEVTAPDGTGKFSHFQDGSIYYSPRTGAWVVLGAIRDKWGELGWELGLLGYPITDSLLTRDGAGYYSVFQDGVIYWSPETGAHEVHGAILYRWQELGGELSSLGYPLSDEGPMADGGAGGRVSYFEGGPLYYTPCTGVTTTLPICGNPTGDCFTDADCPALFTCNNPYDNPLGRCTAWKESYPFPARGRVHWNNGWDHNSCVANRVADEVSALGFFQQTQIEYDPREGVALPPDQATVPDIGITTDHAQGVARIPGIHGDRMMVASFSNTDDYPDQPSSGGLLFVELGQIDGRAGSSFRGGTAFDRGQNRTVAYYRLDTYHPGGIQLLGQIAVVAAEDDQELHEGAVYFYDVSDPVGRSEADALIAKVPLESRFYPPHVQPLASGLRKPTLVGIVPMSSGGYLMAVMRDSRVFLFLTDYAIGPDMRWYFHNELTVERAGNAENMTFVTECDGTVLMLLTGNAGFWAGGPFPTSDSQAIVVHRLRKDGDKLTFELLGVRTGFSEGDWGQFRFAGNFYVSPQGELVLYSAGRSVFTEGPNYTFSEYTVPNFCGWGGGCVLPPIEMPPPVVDNSP